MDFLAGLEGAPLSITLTASAIGAVYKILIKVAEILGGRIDRLTDTIAEQVKQNTRIETNQKLLMNELKSIHDDERLLAKAIKDLAKDIARLALAQEKLIGYLQGERER